MSPTDELVPILKKLRLSGILQTLDLRTRQAVDDHLSYPEFLYRLLNDEYERRDAGQLQLRIRRAGFEHAKSLEDFDFQFNPQVPKAKIIDLATCHFVERRFTRTTLSSTTFFSPAGAARTTEQSYIPQAKK